MEDASRREYLTVPQMSELTSIPPSTLNKYRLYGEGPRYIRVGGRILYRREDVDAWLLGLARKSTAENRKLQRT